MKVTVYLPDEIGEKAKQLELNLSGLLRAAIEEEFMRQEAVAESLEGAGEVILDLHEDGKRYKGRFTGKLLVNDVDGQLYLKDDETLLFYRPEYEQYSEVEVDELQELLSLDGYISAMRALGEEPVVDI